MAQLKPGTTIGGRNIVQELDSQRAALDAHLTETTQQPDILVTVGNGGDFPTINDALEYLSKKYVRHFKDGFTAEVKLLSGFVMEEQVLVVGVDLGWITITSEDAEVPIRRSALVKESPMDYDGYRIPAFGAYFNATLPIIGALYNMDSTGSDERRDGVSVGYNSSAIILPGCGVKNAGHRGLQAAFSSNVSAAGSIFSGAALQCIRADQASIINAIGANASGAGSSGIYAHQASIINAIGANASGAGVHGIRADNASTINANGANARKGSQDDSSDVLVRSAGIIYAYNITGGLSQAPDTLTPQGIIFTGS